MLKQRVITALVLLAILLPAVLYPSTAAFGAVSLVMIAAGAWEWARLNGQGGLRAVLVAALCACVCAGLWWAGALQAPLRLVWLLSGLFWVFSAGWLLLRGVAAWQGLAVMPRLVAGLLALIVAWLAVMQARGIGINFLFSAMVLVWAADVFAYFAGRGLGGRFFQRKLAPSISPGKTWEGALGGLAGVILVALLWRMADQRLPVDSLSIYSRLGGMGGGLMFIALVFLTAMSVAGDLVESLFKRAAGVKDSSGLLPGHGGVLDRLDALLPTLPLAMMLTSLELA